MQGAELDDLKHIVESATSTLGGRQELDKGLLTTLLSMALRLNIKRQDLYDYLLEKSIETQSLTVSNLSNTDPQLFKSLRLEDIKRVVESSAVGSHGHDKDLVKVLETALSFDRLDVATYLIRDVGVPIDEGADHFYGYSLLIRTAGNNQPEICRLLLERGADLSVTDCYGISPLMYAAMVGDRQTVEVLLRHRGVDLDVKDNRGDTALMWAARHGCPDIVRILMARGASMTVRNIWGRTARDIAVVNRQVLAGRVTEGHWLQTNEDLQRIGKCNEEVMGLLEEEEKRRGV